MDTTDLAKSYLNGDAKMMQIATLSDDQPWICTVYFVVDESLNLYWLSLPSRRHSLEIAGHNKVAVAIPIKFDQPIVGIQAEGTAEQIIDHEIISGVMKRYVAKYGTGENFYDNFIAGKNEHVLYKFSPGHMYLFDEVNFTGGERLEVIL